MGASIGGMQALEMAIRFPELVERVISIGAAPLRAMGLGLNHLQRQMIQLDPAWKGGHYPPDQPPREGLALARALAVCTYKSAELFEHRFARKPDRSGEDPWASLHERGQGLSGERFDVAGYLDYQGERFVERFDANAYLAITRTMDTFDPARGYPSAEAAFRRIQAEVMLVGISSDWLFPAAGNSGPGSTHGEGRRPLRVPGADFLPRPRRFSGGTGRAGAAASNLSWHKCRRRHESRAQATTAILRREWLSLSASGFQRQPRRRNSAGNLTTTPIKIKIA